MKAILMSIKPKYCELIANGIKTVEVRKTMPKLELPFKCYIYCTKGKEILGWHSEYKDNIRDNEHEYKVFTLHGQDKNAFNGKVIGYFICDRIVEFENDCYDLGFSETADLSCVGFEALYDYLGAKEKGYGWHISNLVIYDNPKELGEFKTKCKEYSKTGTIDTPKKCHKCRYQYTWCLVSKCRIDGKLPITKPPQSWCYCELGV